MKTLVASNTQKSETFECLKSYLSEKPPDCTIYSQDGYKFNIHKV